MIICILKLFFFKYYTWIEYSFYSFIYKEKFIIISYFVRTLLLFVICLFPNKKRANSSLLISNQNYYKFFYYPILKAGDTPLSLSGLSP